MEETMARHFTQVKVYGERNSGTNFVENTLSQSFPLDVLPNIPDIETSRRENIRKSGLPLMAAWGVIERVWDDIYRQTRLEVRGWKHECVTAHDLTEYANASEVACANLFVVRNPVSWSRSLHKNPFHRLQNISPDYSEFLRQPWATLYRDNLTEDVLAGPLDLWSLKTAQYVALAQEGHGLLLRYEDFLLELDAVRTKLCTYLGYETEALSVKEDGSRGFANDQKTYSQISSEFSFEEVKDSVSQADFQFIMRAVESDLLMECYPELLAEY